MAAILKDVAARAGVALSTASRALAGSPQISERTRLRVERAAADLGYRPSSAAASLRTKRSGLVGLVLGNLINQTFHVVAEVVQGVLDAAGFQLVLCITHADAASEKRFLDLLRDHSVEGVIIAGTGGNAAAVNALRDEGVAVVDLIRKVPGSRGPAVLASDRDAGIDATRHLLDQGHVLIGYIGAPVDTTSGHDRYAGFELAHAERGLQVVPELIKRGPFDVEFGVQAARELLGQRVRPTALLVANHEATSGVLPVLVDNQVQIPDDMSLICVEDMPMLRWWVPPVTVVDSGAAELGRLAVDILLRAISDPGGIEPRVYRVGSELVIRSSCGPPGRGGRRGQRAASTR